MKRLTIWASEWIETWRIAPPFSRRRRNLLAAIREANADHLDPDAWIEVERP